MFVGEKICLAINCSIKCENFKGLHFLMSNSIHTFNNYVSVALHQRYTKTYIQQFNLFFNLFHSNRHRDGTYIIHKYLQNIDAMSDVQYTL